LNRLDKEPAFAAHFAEVRIDNELGLLRVTRIVSAVHGGRILNELRAARPSAPSSWASP
jgi:CO/xanthine dehydrogenase Mo-binding subunit